jgi:hypothetical protein
MLRSTQVELDVSVTVHDAPVPIPARIVDEIAVHVLVREA